MKHLLLLVLALTVLACAEQPANTTETDMDTDVVTTPDMDRPEVDMPAADPTLTATIDAVQSTGGDITALPADAAVSNIDTWINKLDGMDGTDGIVSNLQSLKGELTSGSIDGGRVSELLSTLASETRSVSGGNQGLSALASALEAGAEKLGGK
ncbi:hypothetical protein LEM8419_03323 [Neolewinella maritima]|uniref:Uncharacterized protein n=1 Tax=Neolewinella maritima TaxID=1383882 RepID=A0ABN8F665_9BACT|nr:hypothetical protein [Neolewinella maritima]CAH1002444.1 hypothetical protein LEM8419_03323 [Neolewinella maritima]